jgi:hypothetical protein
LIQLSSVDRAKSLSIEQAPTPCSMASAARWGVGHQVPAQIAVDDQPTQDLRMPIGGGPGSML